MCHSQCPTLSLGEAMVSITTALVPPASTTASPPASTTAYCCVSMRDVGNSSPLLVHVGNAMQTPAWVDVQH